MLILALIIILIRRGNRNSSLLTEDNLSNLATLRRISYHELQQATDGFDKSNLLGTGSFGCVYKATLIDGMDIAVKYLPQGSLEKWLYAHNYFLNIQQRLDIMIDVASALEYLHRGYSTPIIHCDLKPNNVLLDDDMIAHSIAKLLDGVDSVVQTRTLATIGYMSPEYGFEGIISASGDVYSFGILMMETFTRRKPTDEMFTEEMSLKRWVEVSLPLAVTEVADANLLSREVEEEEEADFVAKKNCISSIMQLALKCSAEIPQERINIKDASLDLEKIKINFLMDVQQA